MSFNKINQSSNSFNQLIDSCALTTHSQEKNFLDLFGKDTIYEIPLFQRSYKWTWKKQIEAVTKDFDDLIKDEIKSLHFFGAIMVQRIDTDPGESHRFEVIDGQQRLTTVFLFIMAGIFQMRYHDLDEAVKLFKRFLIDDDKDSENCRLQPTLEDRAQLNWIFDNMLTQDFREKLEEKNIRFQRFGVTSTSKTDGNFRRNYTDFKHYFKKKIHENFMSEDQKGEIIKRIIYKILFSCKVVNLVVRNPQYGPIIFDKLNSCQEKMTISELIKNHIFAKVAQERKNLDSVQHFHDTYWTEFIREFKDNKAADNYFFPLALIENPNTKSDICYRDMTKFWNEKKYSAEQIIDYLKVYLPAYNALSNQKVEQFSKAIQESLINLSRINLSITTYPFVMQLLKKVVDDETFEDKALNILQFLESYFVRRQMCERETTGTHSVFKGLWGKLEKTGNIDTGNLIGIINTGHPNQKIPDDDDFMNGIKKASLANKQIKDFMLEEYDKNFGAEIPECKNRNIEHVLPKQFDHWRNDFNEGEHQLLVNTFANLVFLTDKLNKEVSNKNYETKRTSIDDNAMYGSTRALFKQYKTWKPDDIRNRANEIATWACNRWKFQK